ncbi:hypothetical protein Tco_0948866 [Tanacetum coccineum]
MHNHSSKSSSTQTSASTRHKGKRDAEEIIEKQVVSSKKQKVVNGAVTKAIETKKKVETKTKKSAKKQESSSDEDSSSSDSEEEQKKVVPKKAAVPAKKPESSSEEDSDDSSSDDETPKKPLAAAKNGAAAAKKKDSSSDSDSDDLGLVLIQLTSVHKTSESEFKTTAMTVKFKAGSKSCSFSSKDSYITIRVGIIIPPSHSNTEDNRVLRNTHMIFARTYGVTLFSIHNDEWKSFQCHHQTALRPQDRKMAKTIKSNEKASKSRSQSMKEQVYTKNEKTKDPRTLELKRQANLTDS